MSINVDKICGSLVAQHHVGEVPEAASSRMVSPSAVITANGRTKVQVVRKLNVKSNDAGHCECTNRVTAADDRAERSIIIVLRVRCPGDIVRTGNNA